MIGHQKHLHEWGPLLRSESSGEKARALGELGFSAQLVGTAIGAPEQTVNGWGQDADVDIDARHAERLSELASVALDLGETVTPRAAREWLVAPNRLLGGRSPLDLLAEGQIATVREAVGSFVDGSYV